MELFKLSAIQQNVLIASIIGDGEITKLYEGSRRKNNSYREHYGIKQIEYREWKQSLLPNLLYITPKSQTLRSHSLPLFTQLYPHFYDNDGQKQIPTALLPLCNLAHFLTILYMDDGTLSITKRVNHLKKKIYLAPSIMLALQNFPRPQLDILQKHIQNTFGLNLKYVTVPTGHKYMLKFNSVKDTYSFLKIIEPVANNCPSMFYKTNWNWRFRYEKAPLLQKYPGYEVIASSSERNKPYSQEEIHSLLLLRKQGKTTNEIAEILGRSYWSVIYKVRELRQNGFL